MIDSWVYLTRLKNASFSIPIPNSILASLTTLSKSRNEILGHYFEPVLLLSVLVPGHIGHLPSEAQKPRFLLFNSGVILHKKKGPGEHRVFSDNE